MNDGVAIVLKRMETHPEEFHGDKNKWMFIYKEFFRDAMTEEEKGAIYDRLKEIRKEEFTQRVMETITREEIRDSDEWAVQEARFAPVPRSKTTHHLNAQQTQVASAYSKHHKIAFIEAAKVLGYI